MKMNLTKGDKIFLGLILIGYVIGFILVAVTGFSFSLEGVGNRWIIYPFGQSLPGLNPLTIIMTIAIIVGVMIFMSSVKVFKIVPGKKQSLIEIILEYVYNLCKEAINVKRFIKPTFTIAVALFIFILISNLMTAFPGLNAVADSNGNLIKLTLFQDTWYSPTSDLNTNGAYAVFVLVISHVFAIKAKGVKKWAKTFFEPTPIMFPMNFISEIAKPISHSLRLFGNIMGGGILVLIISYLLKYFVLPAFLWGFFGLFIGFIQAMVFTLLAIAYIGSVIE